MLRNLPLVIKEINSERKFHILETLFMLVFENEKGQLNSDMFHYTIDAISCIRHDSIIPFYEEMHKLCMQDTSGISGNYTEINTKTFAEEYRQKYKSKNKNKRNSDSIKDKILEGILIEQLTLPEKK